jgi:hypothetical protein
MTTDTQPGPPEHYDTEFPPECEAGRTAGLRMLRVAAVRDELGREPLGDLVTAYGRSYWDKPRGSGMRARLSATEHCNEVLAAAGLPERFSSALDDTSWGAVTTLARFPGFAELKRSLREVPQLTIPGAVSAQPEQEDWTGGHRVGHLAKDRAAASSAT